MKLLQRIKAAMKTFKEPSKTPINAYYIKEKIVEKIKTVTKTVKEKGPSKRAIKKRLDELEKQINAGPGTKMSGSCLVKENGKIKVILFETKQDGLDVIQKVRDGKITLAF